jgi:oligopeptide transport system substrate-binding protein
MINTSEAHRKVAEAVQELWRRELGIEIGIYNQEWKVYLDNQSSLNFDLSRSGWIADYAHPSTFVDMFTTGNGNNDTGWSSARYDALIEAARRAGSEEERVRLMHDAEEVLLDEMPIVPIYWYTRVYLLDTKVKGWYPKLLDNHPYKHVWLEPDASEAGK